jgi:hypothetical protein
MRNDPTMAPLLAQFERAEFARRAEQARSPKVCCACMLRAFEYEV